MDKKDKQAFTLAEVLITLGIIGVVAAMTIPMLHTKIRNKILYAQFMTTYSDLNQAAKLFESNEGVTVNLYDQVSGATDDGSGGNLNIKGDNALRKYMSYFKGISTDSNRDWRGFDPAKHIAQRNLSGNATINYPCDESSVIIDMTGRLFATDNSIVQEKQAFGPKICVDINGVAPPNRLGYDRFTFVFTEDNKVVPYTGTSWNGLSQNLTDENQIKNYCSYQSTTPVTSCAYYAAKNKAPDGNGTYWDTF